MKYLDLAIANETIKTTDIKGKPRLQKNGYLTLCIKNNLGKDRLGVEPINKTNIEVRNKIKELRSKGYYLKDICKILNLSYPTVQKYAKEVF